MRIRRRLGVLVLIIVLFSAIFGEAAGNAATGIALNVDVIRLKANMSITLTAMVEPADAANRIVLWGSGDSCVAEVDQQGKVTWKGPGTTLIFATAQDSGKSAVCTVICLAPQEEQSMVCPVCGNPVKDEQKHCGICGVDLTEAREKESEQIFGKKPEAGSIITFGYYPQMAEGTDQTPIEWRVLDYDAENNRALLISRYGLDAQPYNTSYNYVTWEKCTLRTWLNETFLNTAFTAREKAAILTTDVDNGRSQRYSGWNIKGGNNTQDKVFLLSYAEANRYFGVTFTDGGNTKSRVAPTSYAVQQGVGINDDLETADSKAACWWWLRSPGFLRMSAAGVSGDGSLSDRIIDDSSGCVRPALWISLESDIF